MDSRRMWFAGIAVIAAMGWPATTDAGKPDARKSALVEKAAQPWKTVTRWLIEYEVMPLARAEGSRVHEIMAVAFPDRFYHLSAHASPVHPWQVDPACQELFLGQGSACHRWPFNRTYSEGPTKKGGPLGGTIHHDFLLAVVPHWPLADYQAPLSPLSGTPIVPLEAMRSDRSCLLPNREQIAGEDCAVFDIPGVERMWVATNKGVCVMQRDIRHPSSGLLGQRILATKAELVAPGLWMPTEFRSQFFPAKAGARQEAVQREYQVRILRCRLDDDVPVSTFAPVHSPGSLRFDSARQFTQISPGGEDLLSNLVDFMVKYLQLPTRPLPRSRPYIWFLVGLAGGLGIGLIGFGFPRRVGRQQDR